MPEKILSSRTLSSAMLKRIAETELRESPKVRKRALRELRDWIKSQSHISNCRTDSNFLLRFLRMKKFEVADTTKVLDKYLRMRSQHPSWFASLDVREPKLNKLINDGYIFVLPRRDANGRRVVYSRAAAMDATVCTAADVMRAHLLTFEALLEEEDVQVNGVTYVFDERDVNWSHISVWTPSEVSKAFSCCERALPLRHREINFVHLPWTMSLVFQFAKSLLSQKIRERFRTHASFEKLVEHVPADILPMEVAGSEGDMPMAEMIDQWKAVLEERRETILALDLVDYGIENVGSDASVTSSTDSIAEAVVSSSEDSDTASVEESSKSETSSTSASPSPASSTSTAATTSKSKSKSKSKKSKRNNTSSKNLITASVC